jgi:hypothetical protein
MRTKHLFDLGLAALACLALAGCGDTPADKKPAEPHEHKAPHEGGEILELGKEDAHLELIHDHTGGKVVVYVYGSDFDKVLFVEKPTITMMQDGKEVDVPLTAVDPKPDGTAHQWKGEHPSMISDPWNGRIRVKIGGKEFQSPLEGPAHTHK